MPFIMFFLIFPSCMTTLILSALLTSQISSSGFPWAIMISASLPVSRVPSSFSRIISLEDLSTLAGVNKTTLISIFKEVYGTTPIRYINRIRLRKAKELLVNTDTSVSEIADLVGFQSIHYFSRFFKAKENCTPMEYRMRNGQSRYFSFQRQGGSSLW